MQLEQKPKPSILEFDGLGTHWWISFVEKNDLEACKDLLLSTVRDFENNYSRFLPDSYVSRLNEHKILAHPPRDLFDMLQASIDYFFSTNGIFNISVGAQLEQDGYGKTVDHTAKIAPNLPDLISLSESKITVNPSIRIDLGGIGKGWLIDKLADLLEKHLGKGYLINGGGDMYINWPEPIDIALEHPLDSAQYIGTISIKKGGFASSSVLKRTWKKDGMTKQHIIQTTSAVKHIASFVTAESATHADVMATVLLMESAKTTHNNPFDYLLISPDMSFYKSPGFSAVMH